MKSILEFIKDLLLFIFKFIFRPFVILLGINIFISYIISYLYCDISGEKLNDIFQIKIHRNKKK